MPSLIHESELAAPCAGIDEAGRGPWAGPVVAAAVILRAGSIPAGLDDSKALSAARREQLFPMILSGAHVGIGEASVCEIDALNIRRATHLAMARALAALPLAPASALVDGNDAPALPCTVRALVKGDSLSLSIAAASIVAKVHRDRMMEALHTLHPGYGWCNNKGYGTAEHAKALALHGITPHHRRSFAPIRVVCERKQSESGSIVIKGESFESHAKD
jgi:ribonuclease HII